MKTIKNILRRALCVHLYLGTLVALVIHALWGGKSKWVDGIFVTELREDSWPERTWYKSWGGTCFGYGIMLGYDTVPYTLLHEAVHTKQFETISVGGFLVGVVCSIVTLNIIPLFVCWFLSAILVYVAGFIISFLRDEPNAYKNNHFEESATAIGEEMDIRRTQN